MTVRFDDMAEPFPKPDEGAEMAEKLRKNIGEWGLLGREKTPSMARQRAFMIRRGNQKGFRPAGSFEAESHTMFGEFRVYARFVGP